MMAPPRRDVPKHIRRTPILKISLGPTEQRITSTKPTARRVNGPTTCFLF